jgi:hypothetical protein
MSCHEVWQSAFSEHSPLMYVSLSQPGHRRLAASAPTTHPASLPTLPQRPRLLPPDLPAPPSPLVMSVSPSPDVHSIRLYQPTSRCFFCF